MKGDTKKAEIAKALDDVDWVLKTMIAHEQMGDNNDADSSLGKRGLVVETDGEEKRKKRRYECGALILLRPVLNIALVYQEDLNCAEAMLEILHVRCAR
jgi:hypothetical protein